MRVRFISSPYFWRWLVLILLLALVIVPLAVIGLRHLTSNCSQYRLSDVAWHGGCK